MKSDLQAVRTALSCCGLGRFGVAVVERLLPPEARLSLAVWRRVRRLRPVLVSRHLASRARPSGSPARPSPH